MVERDERESVSEQGTEPLNGPVNEPVNEIGPLDPKVLKCAGAEVSGDKMRKERVSADLTPLPIPGTLHAARRNSMWADFAWQKSNYS